MLTALSYFLRREKYSFQSSDFFYVHVTVHRNKFLVNKTNRRTNFPNLFYEETLHVCGSSSAHPQEFFTVHLALAHVTQF
jgi:hypothetical protein